MDTVMMNRNGCDIGHEALVDKSPVAQISRHANNRGRANAPNVVLSSAQVEVIESVGLFRSTAFPQCP